MAAEATLTVRSHSPVRREPLVLGDRLRFLSLAAFSFFIVLAAVQFLLDYHSLDHSILTEDTVGWPRHDRLILGLEQLGIPLSAPAWFALIQSWLAAVLSFGLALLVVMKRPGQVMALVAATFVVSASVATYPPDIAVLAEKSELRATLATITTLPFPAGLVLLPFLFPDGRFVPRWTAVPVGLVLASLAYDFLSGFDNTPSSSGLTDVIELTSILLLALGSQAYRWFRASDEEARRRTRLFAIGIGLNLGVFVILNIGLDIGGFDRPDYPPVQAVIVSFVIPTLLSLTTVFFSIILLAAIVREQLFGIQMVLNRTLVYAGLTAVVVGGYLGFTTLIAHVLDTQGGLAGVLGAATAMLAVYPARGRLQHGVDRLVYGQRDAPWAVLSALSRRFEGAVPAGEVLEEVARSVTQALKLPYAAVYIGEAEAPAAEAGTPTTIARRIPLLYHDDQLGWLGVAAWPGTPLRPQDVRLLEELAHQAGAAVNAVRLTVELQQSRERLVTAREEERRRLRRDLHDGLGPRLAGMMMRAEAARSGLEEGHPADRGLADLEGEISAAIGDIRRLVYGLRPPALDELGLVAALRQAADGFETSQLVMLVEAPEALPPLSAAIEVAAFRIAQEAMTNVVRHAQASRCVVSFSVEPRRLRLTIADDGVGIPANAEYGVGLRSMQERAEEVGGIFEAAARAGGGTLVTVSLPILPAGGPA